MKKTNPKFYITAVCFLIHISSFSQLCNNNLGDPVVNVDFGTNHEPYIPTNTSYDYVGGCPSKGQFTIADFLFGCGGTWVATIGDHTPFPDLNGNYMLVNAESTPGVVYTGKASGLCENMTYQFSAWITNVLQPGLSCGADLVLPNLTFTIESTSGTLLATYSTGDIPAGNEAKWKQYGLTYKTTAGINEVVLKVTTNPRYGCGNAFAIDDIIFQNCGPSVNVTIDGTTDNQDVCAGYKNPFIMQGSYSAGFSDPVVQWQKSLDTAKTWIDIAGATTTTYQVPYRNSGVIEYRMVVAERENINSPYCRMRSNAIYTEVHPKPEHRPTEYINGCSGKDYALPKGDDHAFEFEWTGPNGYSSTDRNSIITDLQIKDTGLYLLRQTYDFGCVDFDSVYLFVAQGIVITAAQPTAICEGESETLSITTSMSGTLTWSPATGLSNTSIPNPVANPIDSTIYKVIATNSYGCQDSAFLNLNVYKRVSINAGGDKIIFLGDTVVLDGIVKGTAVNYSWSPPIYINDVNATQPKVYPPQNTTYILSASSTVGCGSATDDVMVSIYKDIFIPNSFTPNGDGKNDRFRLANFDAYTVKRFVIYNRWGTVIFSSKKLSEGWDGTVKGLPQPMGTYIYYVELENSSGKKIVRQGTLQLLR